MKQVLLMIGTRKGGFLAVSDVNRKSWELQDPVFKGAEVNFMHLVPGSPPVIYMAGKSAWWGPDLRISRDFGHTWVEPATPVRFAVGRGLALERIWVIAADPRSEQQAVYVGVDPAALLRSPDGGHTWEDIRSLTEHPTRHQWMPGAG
jgi:hypothetical protein